MDRGSIGGNSDHNSRSGLSHSSHAPINAYNLGYECIDSHNQHNTHNYHFELYKHHAKYHHNFSVHPPASK